MRDEIAALVGAISPFDQLERDHLAAAAAWIASGAPLCRTAKPATPPRHLVSYVLVVDPARRAVLLVDHKLAGLWLPCGGHVEPGEHPAAAAARELGEELGLPARFLAPGPLFLTVTETVGATAGHTDVSLWFVASADSAIDLAGDPGEFHGVSWFPFAALPHPRTDPHLQRCVDKLGALLAASAPQ